MAFQFDSRVRYSEMGTDKRLTLGSLVNYFQDCSTFQSELCGQGIDALSRRHQAWLVLSWQIEITRRPLLGEKIITKTWPYAFKAFYGYRHFVLEDEAGGCLAKANSVWVLMDTDTGRPVKVPPEVLKDYPLEPRLAMREYPRKIREPEGGKEQEPFLVAKAQIDTNGHVNNSQYIRMAEDYLPDGFETEILRVEYRSQARIHDVIVPVVHSQDDTITVGLHGNSTETYAVLTFTGRAAEEGAGI